LPWYERRDTQRESFDLSAMFRERFPQWAEQYRQQAQSNTNMPPFSEEDQLKVDKLVEHAQSIQKELVENVNPDANEESRRSLREQALNDLLEARSLLPRQANQNQCQSQQQQQQQQQQEQQQQDQQQEEQQQEEKPEEKQEEQKQEQPKDVQELLRRALEREKEHEEDKKERMRKMPMKPGERDW
jgi:hypothetical protein